MKQTAFLAPVGLLSTLFLLHDPNTAHAQSAQPASSEPSTGDIRVGVKLGINDSTFDQKVAEEFADQEGFFTWDSRTGILAGLSGSFYVDKYFRFQVDGLYIMKGAELNPQEGFEQVLGRVSFSYGSLSFLLDAGLPTSSGIRPFVLIGPTVSLLLTAESEREDPSVGGIVVEDIKDEVKSHDLGLLLGVGVSIPVGSGDLVLDARYEDGFTNIVTEDQGIFVLENQMFAIAAGYMF